jgi:hypothetical protein
VVISSGRNRTQNCDSLGLAILTAFGFVLELFVMKKQLLSGGKNKVGAAIYTLENLVLEFH